MFRDYLAFASVGMEPIAPFEDAPGAGLTNTNDSQNTESVHPGVGFSRADTASATSTPYICWPRSERFAN